MTSTDSSAGAADMATVDRRFAAQARRTPDAVAAVHGDERITYREMDRAADRLASALGRRGLGPGQLVGLSVESGITRGIALVGALRAGTAYVPLDPAYPRERLQFMASDAELPLIVATSASASVFDGMAPVAHVGDLVVEGRKVDASPSQASPEGAAYLIYTSGSTGRPKGVVMPHRALANLIGWQVAQPGFDRPVRTLQFTALSFDVHFQEIFATWATGGELVYVDDPIRRDPTRLLALLDKSAVERIFLPFVALQQLAEVATTHGPLPTALREIVTAGEQLQVNEVIRSFFGRLPHCRLHNHYGPSETHVVTAHTLEGPPATWPLLPPIGRPIANTVIHLLAGDGTPVEKGEAGELCAAGLCLADGYWRRPELTHARFVPAPGGPGLMYRTGDLARMDASGNLEFLGRLDDQFKIRGHRVEPGEIEAKILEHPAVRECAVAARKDPHGGQRLTGYLVLDSSRPGVRARAETLRQEKLSQWQGVWDGTYARGDGEQATDLDLRGWVDSYHGQPIPEAEMRSWAEGSTAQVLALRPQRVLEIGTGTGLMLFRIAPHCRFYHGTDFSPRAVDLLRTRSTAAGLGTELRLDVASANDIGRFEGQGYDVVLLNSVTQHFPTIDYLVEVLRSAAALVGDGHIFVGDVTNRALREAFFSSVEGARARAGEPLLALRGRVERRLGQEEELVVDPRFFERLAEWVPSVASVEVRLKPGRYSNELSRFRYDVLVRVSSDPSQRMAPHGVAWRPELAEPDAMSRLLAEHDASAVRIEGIPNARVVDVVAGARALQSNEGGTVAAWRAASVQRTEASHRDACEPQDLVDLVETLGRPAQATWSERLDCFDLIVRPANAPTMSVAPIRIDDAVPLERLASQPLNVALMPKVEAELRRQLGEAMPDYMVPDRFELLARLTTTPSGKLDRRALPEPGRHRPPLPHDYVAPKGEMEELLAAVWSETLGVDRVGATDSFFDLGGNSILSVRVAALLKQRIACDLPLVSFFHHPTVRALAAILDGSDAATSGDDALGERAMKQRRALFGTRRVRRN